ncbi:MAG: efflux transporter outer membrane subunit [Polaromonas sp.]|uniref:efflux transporter outer membrane subunit n=1 Tax=Polaromonas sp. TaxID=1869339 RepID=UPI0018565C86|nr:efflux transporter outer membrane subunit [Polaromonas sp.]NMM09693.1 efflux transporter outer membrane subunit [Polaromonas sp.]
MNKIYAALRASKPLAVGVLSGFGLAGCAVGPAYTPVSVAIPTTWQAPLPHQGTLTNLSQWWQQQNDPLLVELIMAAETISPTIASARSNIEQARASRIASGAALLPTLDATASATRGRSPPVNRASPPIATTEQAGLQASWEIDLFGRYRDTQNANQQRLEGSAALWHAARVSVAAEVANQYYSRRTCEKLLSVARADAASRLETARLAELSAKAGFQAPATAALARASAAEGNGNAIAQRALCDLDIKALVAMTAIDEPALRQKLAQPAADTAQETMPPIASVPAEVLAQRPDVFNAAREVDAAHAEVGSALAQRYPRLSLSGSIETAKSIARGVSQRFDTWSVGPLQLTVPLFDGGVSAANVEAAKARYQNAAVQYRSSVRQAVREVEEALVNLQSTAERNDDAKVAAAGYRASFTGTEAKYKSGLASLIELEDARRTSLASETAVVTLQRERSNAWVALYRALGGGWTSASPTPPAPLTDLDVSSASASAAAATP